MKVLIHHTWLAMVLAALLLNLAACQKSVPKRNFNGEAESLEEAMVEVAADAGDIKRTIELADSFVKLNLLSPIRADFYKAMACSRQENILRWMNISKGSSRPMRMALTSIRCSIAGQP